MPFAHSRSRVAVEIGVVVAILGVLAGGLIVGGRWLADRALANVPASVDLKLGELAAQAYAAQMPACGNPTTEKAVLAIVDRLKTAAASPEPLGPLTVKVSSSAEVNAFALPGGHIYVLAGLLEKIEHPDELAGILAHEIGHVARRHHIRNLGRSLGLSLALTAVLGDLDALTGSLVGVAEKLTALAFSREQEADADEFGARLALRAGFSPAALGRFLARLGGPQVPGFLQDHPTGADRERTLAALAARLGPVPAWSGPPIVLADLKAGCRP